MRCSAASIFYVGLFTFCFGGGGCSWESTADMPTEEWDLTSVVVNEGIDVIQNKVSYICDSTEDSLTDKKL